MDQIWSYPKVWNLGHPALRDLLDGPVTVQEKLDGSQFSFRMVGGDIHIRSKGADIYPETPDKMFAKAVATVMEIRDKLRPGWVYRAEAVTRPKHNTIQYGRAPDAGFVLFDCEAYQDTFESYDVVAEEARSLGLECVPQLNVNLTDMDALKDALQTESMLGGALIEGIVVKNYIRFGRDGRVLMGKYVSEAFKETHSKAWRKSNPTRGDILEELIDEYRSPARWAKAVQHLRDRGELEGTPRDIGKLIAEAKKDLAEEGREPIMERLWRHFADKVIRGATAGLAEWYKEELAKAQFEGEGDDQ